jgi:phytoene desaturase
MPALSIREYISPQLFYNALQIQLFTTFRTHLSRYFSHPRLLALMEFPVLFLGGTAENTPALYSLMNYAGLSLGTWYPMGGFGKVIEAMKDVAEEAGAEFHFHAAVEKIKAGQDDASAIRVNGAYIETNGIVASADYHHVENHLLPEEARNYKNGYWHHKTMSPSCLIYFLGIKKKINRLQHHTLFFDEDLNLHAKEIYHDQRWPQKPLFYVCCPSKTDPGVAPEGCENLFLLMPIASGLEDTAERRAFYFDEMMGRLETLAGEAIRPFIEFQKSYCINDFISDYNAYKGNAYGLANTLNQTAVLRPKIKNHKLKNLFYAGQLTVPGPGVPPAIISGKIAAGLLHKQLVHA